MMAVDTDIYHPDLQSGTLDILLRNWHSFHDKNVKEQSEEKMPRSMSGDDGIVHVFMIQQPEQESPIYCTVFDGGTTMPAALIGAAKGMKIMENAILRIKEYSVARLEPQMEWLIIFDAQVVAENASIGADEKLWKRHPQIDPKNTQDDLKQSVESFKQRCKQQLVSCLQRKEQIHNDECAELKNTIALLKQQLLQLHKRLDANPFAPSDDFAHENPPAQISDAANALVDSAATADGLSSKSMPSMMNMQDTKCNNDSYAHLIAAQNKRHIAHEDIAHLLRSKQLSLTSSMSPLVFLIAILLLVVVSIPYIYRLNDMRDNELQWRNDRIINVAAVNAFSNLMLSDAS